MLRSFFFVGLFLVSKTLAQDPLESVVELGSSTLQFSRLGGGEYAVRFIFDNANPLDEWLAIGFSSDSGNCGMLTVDMVIGKDCGVFPCEVDVGQFRATGSKNAGPSVITDAPMELQNTSFSKVGSTMTLEFVASQVGDVILDDVTCAVWAKGSLQDEPNTDFIAKHDLKEGDLALSLQEPTTVPTVEGDSVAPTQSPSLEPTEGGESVASLSAFGGRFLLQWEVLEDNESVRITIESPMAAGWVAVGISPGQMSGTQAIIAGIGSGLPALIGEYDLGEYVRPMISQNSGALRNTLVENSNNKLRVQFETSRIGNRRVVFERPQTIAIAFREGNSFSRHQASAIAQVDWNLGAVTPPLEQSDQTAKYVAHGVLMILSFTFIFPLGMVPSVFREKFGKEGNWFNFHRAVQIVGVMGVIAAFGIAVYLVNDRETDHFDSKHTAVGLSLFIVVLLQPVLAMFFRKGKVRPFWQGSHFLFATYILIGGLYNSFKGIEVGEDFIDEEKINAIEAFLYVGAAITCLSFVVVFLNRANKACTEEIKAEKGEENVKLEEEPVQKTEQNAESGPDDDAAMEVNGNDAHFSRYDAETNNDDVQTVNLT